MPNPSGAVRLGGTLYRIREVAWLKVQRLTMWEKLTNLLLIVSGVIFLLAMERCKGNWYSLEELLGLLPLCLGLAIHGDTRLASSGDTQDSYFGRGLGFDVRINELARPLREQGDGFLELNGAGSAYFYMINTDRLAWVSSWYTANTWPLWMGLLFFGYAWVLAQGFHMPSLPAPVDNLKILEFANPDGVGLVQLAANFCGVAGLLSLVASFKMGVILGSVGGVADTMHMYSEDRNRLMDILAGPDAPARPVAVKPAPVLRGGGGKEPVVVEALPPPAPKPAPPPPPAAPPSPAATGPGSS